MSGSTLARQAGFRQAHISNFLNRKRALSLPGLDRVLAAQNLSLDQIMPVELSAAASVGPALESIEAVPVVSLSTARDVAVVRPEAVIETIHVSTSQLQDNRSRLSPKYAKWQRFVAIRADEQQAAAMAPMIGAGAVVMLDRHYNSLAPYRAQQKSLYAVRCGPACLVLRFVEFDDGRLILRPLSASCPVQLLALGAEETPADYIVGRVCLVVSEL